MNVSIVVLVSLLAPLKEPLNYIERRYFMEKRVLRVKFGPPLSKSSLNQ
jgi:hypothetical protein